MRDATFEAKFAGFALPDAVTTIGTYAFRGCTGLAEIIIPEGVKKLDAYTFSMCSALSSIVLPASLTSISADAFNGCTTLVATVTPLSYAHAWCVSNKIALSGMQERPEEFTYSVNLTTKAATITGYTGQDEEIVIPEAICGLPVTAVGGSAFKGKTALRHVVIPEGITTLGTYAFSGCTSLEGVVLPEGLLTISNYAFQNCTMLTSLEIPESVNSMATYVFKGCTELVLQVKPGSYAQAWCDTNNAAYEVIGVAE